MLFSTLCLFDFVGLCTEWGAFQSILYSDFITCDHNKTLDQNVSSIQVYFYDFKNDLNMSYPIQTAASEIANNTVLDVNRRLVLFVPGFKTFINKETAETIRQAFRNESNAHLIIVDHSAYTSVTGSMTESYSRSVSYAYYIGVAIGKFLAELRGNGFPSSKIHGVGHSLGSHMLGYVGSTYTNLTSEKIWRITGLDPAGPCFSNSLTEDQIRSGLAEYVEVYHCNSGGYGTTSVLADADFYFNKGNKQPDCDGGVIPVQGDYEAARCSHKACVTLWAKTVSFAPYLALACDSYKAFSNGSCDGNEFTVGGYGNPGNATGVFYISTDGNGTFV